MIGILCVCGILAALAAAWGVARVIEEDRDE